MKKKIIICLVCIIGLGLFLPQLSFAQADLVKPLTEDELQKLLQKPQPRINIPGLNFSDINIEGLKEADSKGDVYLHIPFLGEYLSAMYRYGIIVISIVAVVMIIAAGMQWIMSGGSPDAIGSAKKRLTGALIGLLLAVGSYSLLYTINPNLVSFKNLKVLYVAGEPFPEIDFIEEKVSTIPVTTDANNVPDYKQFSATWGNLKYGYNDRICTPEDISNKLNPKDTTECCTTIAQAGCGPTSLAMVLSSYADSANKITPDMTADFIGQSKENGRTCNVGTSLSRTISKLPESPWSNFTGKQIKKEEALNLLSQGKPIIFLCIKCSGFNSTENLKKYNAHYMVLKSINQNSRIDVNDPGGNKNTAIKTMTKDQLDNSGGFWYIHPK